VARYGDRCGRSASARPWAFQFNLARVTWEQGVTGTHRVWWRRGPPVSGGGRPRGFRPRIEGTEAGTTYSLYLRAKFIMWSLSCPR
jgi:hypothetical protein